MFPRYRYQTRRTLCFLALILFFPSRIPAQGQVDPDSTRAANWEVRLRTSYQTRYTYKGIDLSEDESTMSVGGGISHSIGFGFDISGIHTSGSEVAFDQSWFSLSFERSVTEMATLTIDYTRYRYSAESLNALAALENSISIGASIDPYPHRIFFSYDRYFGEKNASFFNAGLSTSSQPWRVYLMPTLQFDFISHTVANRARLPRHLGTTERLKSDGEKTTISGLSEISASLTIGYTIATGLDLSLIPEYVYSPTDLASKTSRFLWSFDLDYSIDF